MMTTMTSSTAAALKLKAETKAADLATEALAQVMFNAVCCIGFTGRLIHARHSCAVGTGAPDVR